MPDLIVNEEHKKQCGKCHNLVERTKMKENDLRTIICKHTSEMLDNPDKYDIYPTTKFYNNLIEAIEQYVDKENTKIKDACEHSLGIQDKVHEELKKGLIEERFEKKNHLPETFPFRYGN